MMQKNKILIPTAENNLGNKGLFQNFFNTFIEFLILK